MAPEARRETQSHANVAGLFEAGNGRFFLECSEHFAASSQEIAGRQCGAHICGCRQASRAACARAGGLLQVCLPAMSHTCLPTERHGAMRLRPAERDRAMRGQGADGRCNPTLEGSATKACWYEATWNSSIDASRHPQPKFQVTSFASHVSSRHPRSRIAKPPRFCYNSPACMSLQGV